MALLIKIGHDGWYSEEEMAAELRSHTPDADIRVPSDPGNLDEITMLAVSKLDTDLPQQLPNLQLVQKLGAGVETIVGHPALAPSVRVARLKPVTPAREIGEFFLAYILQGQRNIAFHRTEQDRSVWSPTAPKQTPDTVVGVLGLGHIGGLTAQLLQGFGFQVHGWSRSAKDLEGVTCHHGSDGLAPMLAQCDYVCAILPSTDETRSLIGPKMLAAMKPGSTFLNAGRGDLVDEPALIAALDKGTPGHAVLDVVSQEPLPADSPIWQHPKITLTPHVSGWHLGDALKDVAENLRRLQTGDPLLHEVDRQKGY